MTQEGVSALLPEPVEELLLGGTCVRLEVGGVSIERIGSSQIDLETAGERVRAVTVAAGKLLCSAVYYKRGRAGLQNKIAEAPSSQQ